MPGSKPPSNRSSFGDLLRRWRDRDTALAAFALVAGHVALLVLYDLAARPVSTFAVFALTFGCFAVAAWRGEGTVRPATVLGIAALLRVLLLPLPPTLSDDVLRYLWDGKVVAAGYNPYRLPPEAGDLQALRDASWQRMPHREVPTVYPPLALGAFSIASALPMPVLAWKLILALADLWLCWLLVRLARAGGLPPGRALWYAWNPLVSLEVAGMAHVDGLAVPFAVAAVLLLGTRRPGLAAASAVAGAAAKLGPLLALPMWARQSGRPWKFLGIAAVAIGLAFLPVAALTGGVPPGLVRYGISWEFNGPLFEPLWRLLDLLRADLAVKAQLDQLKALTGAHDLWNPLYPYVYPQLLAKALLAVGLAIAIFRSLAESGAVTGSGRLFGAAILCSATVYPWYVLWVLPWAALRRHPAWLAAAGVAPLAYLPQLCGVPLFPWVYLAVWVPFFALLASPASRWSGG